MRSKSRTREKETTCFAEDEIGISVVIGRSEKQLASRDFHDFVIFLVVCSRAQRGVMMMSPAEYPDRIWFNPAKFWAATKDMPPKAAEELLDRIIELAEFQDLEELRKFDFV